VSTFSLHYKASRSNNPVAGEPVTLIKSYCPDIAGKHIQPQRFFGFFDDFSQYLKKYKPSKWEDINGELKSDMRFHMLLNEQECLCGYSEIVLEAENTSSHIDHFVKQAHDHNKIFDWNNFITNICVNHYA
jgi:hypothetical protein